MAEKQKVYFRADAGPKIGYGHFIRSLALADMLKSDFECVMFTQTPTEYQKKEASQVCQLVSLPADESRFDKFLTYLTGNEIVVLDNYFYTTEYQRQIKDKGCKLVCIDDIHDKHFVADVVINHGFASAQEYDVEDYTQVCTGSMYALLRRPFLQQQPLERRSHSWLVTIGGSDELNITTLAVKKLQDLGVKDITAIVGDGFRHYDTLSSTGINVLSRLTAQQMAETFAATENVVCCASSVCYEALSQGCKVYAGWYVDNQVEIYEGLKNEGYIVPLGNLSNIDILVNDSVLCNKFVVSDIRNNLRALFVSDITIRLVTYKDAKILYDWVNDRAVRESAFNSDLINWEEHVSWLTKRIASKRSWMYICYYQFYPIGQVRFDVEGATAELDYSLDNKYRGRGFSVFMLQTALIQLRINNPKVQNVIAMVKKTNIVSQKTLLRVGFNNKSICKSCIVFNYSLI